MAATARPDWAPVSNATMRHVLEQLRGPREVGDDELQRIATRFRVPSPGIVHFATQRRRLGSTLLVLMTLSAMCVQGARSAPSEQRLHVGFVLGGAITITPRGGDPVRLGAGGSCAIADWSSFDAESANGTRCLQLLLPYDRLVDRGVHVSAARFSLDGARSLRSPLRGFALAIVDAAWNASTVGELVAERTIEDLVVGMFLEADGYSMDSEDLRAALRARAMAEIAATHRHAGLTPAVVAERLRVSLRHLQRAFENSGDSVAHAIARHRAESAALLLLSPGASGLTIVEIARDSGFRSAFELRTAFRDRYEVLPSAYRDAHEGLRRFAPQQG